ncbi:MAG: ABC transporter permease [Bdellovibrionales bacterium]|nr:ABC transporter permease [Bdellovibrionales bacterium]
MTRTLKLIASALLTLLAISLLTFLLMKLVPGGPFDGDKAVPPEVLAALNAKFRLDLPWYDQFGLYMRDLVLHFDMGPSIKFIGRSVNDIVAESFPVSFELGMYALALAVVLGVSMGIMAAAFRGTTLDFTAMLVAISGVSLPSFLVAALAILVFAQTLGWFPAALWDGPEHKVLPAIVLGLRPAAILARMTRSSVLEVLYLDYVRTARAKGLHPLRVLLVHVLRNALLPVLTVLGPLSATVLTGSFVIEYVFSIPGLASHFIQAVNNRDYPLVMGVTILYAAMLVFVNLVIDMLYTLVDPRIRLAKEPG